MNSGERMDPGSPPAPIRWPNVPACYGWLSLDRRGNWRLKGEPVRHSGLVAFINRNYGPDGTGNWIFRNGPQTVYVSLDYAPLVLRLEADGELSTHTGIGAGRVESAWIDDEGNVLLHTLAGLGLLDDRDLAGFAARCTRGDGQPLTDDDFSKLLQDEGIALWQGLTLKKIPKRDVPHRFMFNPEPST